MENLDHNGPVLLLPNHVALVDPRILLYFLGKHMDISPVASEKYYNRFLFKQLMQLVGTIPIGDLENGGDKDAVREAFSSIVSALESGKNVLLYPSGQIYRQGFESIIGKQSAFFTVQSLPENTRVLGVRVSGLWGSMWSMVWDNGKSGMVFLFLKAFWLVLANGIFFLPKREVGIEIEDIT